MRDVCAVGHLRWLDRAGGWRGSWSAPPGPLGLYLGAQDGQGGGPQEEGAGRKGSRGREEPSADLFIACIRI